TMNIAQSDYELVTPESFTCIADFETLNANQNRVALSLQKIPDNIELIEWGEKSAEFIIIKR
ncbi:MAG: hypothetical protein N4A46_15080, partial [Schleiferiaceae bacterium]|nr:hypothetical protein [Schleiferiaceae bacterium]